MKKTFYSIGSIIILLIAALIFVFVPALSESGVSTRSPYPEYGSYNNKPIYYEEGSDFANAVDELVRYYESMGIDLNSEYAATIYDSIFAQAFQNVIGSYALEYYTKSSGYIIPNSAIRRNVRSLPQYQDSSGTFSPAIYQSYSETEKRDIQDRIEKHLTQMRSYEDLFGSFEEVGTSPLYGLKPSSAEIEFIRKMSEKQSSFDIAIFDTTKYPDDKKISFAKEHKDLFVKYNLKVITCDSKDKATKAHKRISKGEIKFEDAFTEYSNGIYGEQETGVISASYKFQLENIPTNPDDLDKILNLAPNEISTVIESPSAYCIFQSTAIPTEPDFDSEEVKDIVFTYLLTREKSIIEDYYCNIANDFATKAISTSFDNALESFDAQKTSIASFALNYNNAELIGQMPNDTNSLLRGISTNENFLRTAFKLRKDEISSPVVLSPANQVLVLKCANITTTEISSDDAKSILAPAIDKASKTSINYSLLSSDKIKYNNANFMAAFNRTIAE